MRSVSSQPASPRSASPKRRSSSTPTSPKLSKDSPKLPPKPKVMPKRPPRSTSAELIDPNKPSNSPSDSAPSNGSVLGAGGGCAALHEQLVLSQKRELEQRATLDTMRKLLEQAQLHHSRVSARCARLAELVGESSDGELYDPPSSLDEDGSIQRSMGLQDIGKLLRKAPAPLPFDAAQVFQSLPLILQDAFDARSVDALDTALRSMPAFEAHFHMQRCVDASLWEV